MPTGQRSRAKRTSEQDLLYEEKAKEKLCDIPNSVSWSRQTVQNLCDHPTAEEIYDAARSLQRVDLTLGDSIVSADGSKRFSSLISSENYDIIIGVDIMDRFWNRFDIDDFMR